MLLVRSWQCGNLLSSAPVTCRHYVSVSSAGCRSLQTCLALAGPAVTPHLQQLLASLISSMTEEDADIVMLLASCCRLVGAFAPCNAWLPLLVDALSDPKAGDTTRANALVVTSCLIHAAAAAQHQPEQQLLQLLVHAIAAEEVRCSEHLGVQTQLLAVVANLLAWMPEEVCKSSTQQLYLMLLQLHGNLSQESEAPAGGSGSSSSNKAEAVLQRLAHRTGLSSLGQLADAHGQQLLAVLTADSSSWTASSPNLLAFMSLLRTAQASCLACLLPAVAQVRRNSSTLVPDWLYAVC